MAYMVDTFSTTTPTSPGYLLYLIPSISLTKYLSYPQGYLFSASDRTDGAVCAFCISFRDPEIKEDGSSAV